jgi:hypothetical protein
VIASVSLRAVFYLLVTTAHPPVLYSELYGLSLLGALGFIVALGVYVAPRSALLASFALLNVYFAWTSHLLSDASHPFDAWLGKVIASQCQFLWVNGGLVDLFPSYFFYFPSYYVVFDLESLALFGVLVASILLLNRDMGAKRAALLSLQVAALCFAILETEIAVFDRRELFFHVTSTQQMLRFESWFTNADLLVCALAVFAVTTFLLNFGRLWHQRY